MKKIIAAILFLISIGLLSACGPKEITLTFEAEAVFTHYIGNEIPNYKEKIIAKLSDGTNLIDDVIINEALVNYQKVGSYTVLFYLTYNEKTDQLQSTVNVERQVNQSEITFNFYYLNDLHGAILESEGSMGLAKIGNVVMKEKTSNPDTTVFLAGGDMLQGQIISNWYDGASVIDLLNTMQLDAFVVGNHEFDWGIDAVTQYFNGNNTMQANFPLLGANVYEKSSNQIASDFEPYTIIEKSGVKIGVIGTMGYGLESSISYMRVKDHMFVDPVERVSYWSNYLRTTKAVDMVLAINHQDHDYFNIQVAQLTGNQRVDAIFNGHTHQAYVRQSNGIPVIQTGANGSNLGKVSLTYDLNSGVTSNEAINLNESNDTRLNQEDAVLASKIDTYYQEIDHLYETMIVSGEYYSQSSLAIYIAKLMQLSQNADVGLHNFGGTRAPISDNEEISYSKLFQISPFDNTVVVVEINGSLLLSAISGHAASFRPGLNESNILPNQTYKLALNDYIFGSNESLRDLSGVTYSGQTVLDLFVEVVENQVQDGASVWTMSLPISFNQTLSYIYQFRVNNQLYV